MVDNVSIPVDTGSPRTVATDEVDLGSGAAHVQYVKVADGTGGGVSVQRVTAAGTVMTTPMCGVVVGGVSDATDTYADGDCIGTGAFTDEFRAGLWRLDLVSLIGLGVSPLPAGIGVLFVPSSTSDPWEPADHAPPAFTGPPEYLCQAASVYVPASAFEPCYGPDRSRVARPEVLSVLSTFDQPPDLTVDIRVTAVAIAEGAVSDDLSDGFVLSGFWTLVGSSV